MAQWVRICSVMEAPREGEVRDAEAEGVSVCLARIGGVLSAVDNWCPHRRGPLGQGWVEGNSVVCPWHAWTFDVTTGISEWPVKERVAVFPLRTEGDAVLVDIEGAPPQREAV